MKVIVDTCIWSLALRRQQQPNNKLTNILRDLITDGRVEEALLFGSQQM